MFFKIITISILVDKGFITAFKAIGAGCATISISGSAIGIGVIFGSLVMAYAKNPAEQNQLFNYAIIGFALTEAIALFGLMIVLLILFG
jgi:F-type H+-transporting ATPase subunit c